MKDVDNFVKFEGCYHGHSDHYWLKRCSGALTLGMLVLQMFSCLAKHTITLQYKMTIEEVKRCLSEIGYQIAAL